MLCAPCVPPHLQRPRKYTFFSRPSMHPSTQLSQKMHEARFCFCLHKFSHSYGNVSQFMRTTSTAHDLETSQRKRGNMSAKAGKAVRGF